MYLALLIGPPPKSIVPAKLPMSTTPAALLVLLV